MRSENPVFQLLFPSGNQAILASGLRYADLKNGQLGFFNYHTGLSVDGSVPVDTKDIVIVMGVNTVAGGTSNATDIIKSAGQLIQVRHTKALTVKGTVGEVQKVTDVSGYVTLCDTDYVLNIEYRNQKLYRENGFNMAAKPYAYHTLPCALPDCDDCSQAGDPMDLAINMMNIVNSDSDQMITMSLLINSSVGNLVIGIGTEQFTVPVLSGDTPAVYVAKIVTAINASTLSKYAASATGAILSAFTKVSSDTVNTPITTIISAGGTGITVGTTSNSTTAISNPTGFQTANPGVAPIMRITSIPQPRPLPNGSINLTYYKTGTDYLIALREGFTNNGTITIITPLQYPEGMGYDLQQQEYVAGGWNGNPGPYRTSAVTGLQKNNFNYFAIPSANYNQVIFEYYLESVAGFLDHSSDLKTIIAFPCADTTTLQGFIAISDLIFTQFGPMTNDVASMGCSNSRTGLLTPATDGVESLS